MSYESSRAFRGFFSEFKKNFNDERTTSMHPIVTRATNAARVRPEDDSTYVTTLFELTGFEFLSSKVDLSKMSELSVGRQKCQLDVKKNVRNVSWTSEMSEMSHQIRQ